MARKTPTPRQLLETRLSELSAEHESHVKTRHYGLALMARHRGEGVREALELLIKSGLA